MKPIYQLLRRLGHQRWLRFGIRDRIIRLFHQSDTAASELFTVPFYGYIYEGNLNSFIDWSTYFYGAYSYQELDLMHDILSQQTNAVFIDVGGNVGNHSLFAAAHCQQVVAFEPVPYLYQHIRRKQRLNNLANVSVFNCALGEDTTVSSFLLPSSGNQGTGRIPTVGESVTGETITVDIKNGDAFLAEMGINRVSLIKIDVEGYEPFVLRGLPDTMALCRPLVFFEWSTASADQLHPSTILSLFPVSYKIFYVNSHRPAYFLFEHKRYQLQLAHDTMPEGNYLAIPTEAFTDGRTALLQFIG